MSLTRTSLRINTDLKRAAEKQALEDNTTLQAILNAALEQYLNKRAKAKGRRIVFHSHDIGEPLDNLRRGDFYRSPQHKRFFPH